MKKINQPNEWIDWALTAQKKPTGLISILIDGMINWDSVKSNPYTHIAYLCRHQTIIVCQVDEYLPGQYPDLIKLIFNLYGIIPNEQVSELGTRLPLVFCPQVYVDPKSKVVKPNPLVSEPTPKVQVHIPPGTDFNESPKEPPLTNKPSKSGAFLPAIFGDLPPILKEATDGLKTRNEQEAFLVSALAIISGILPNVIGHYNGKLVEANLYAYILGPYGVGKGTLEYARMLAAPIHRARLEEAKDKKLIYEATKAKYDKDLKVFQRDKSGQIDPPVPPDSPPVLLLFIPANNSKSGVYQLLNENEERGILYETEADALTDALKAEHGKFSEGLRKAFHHEPITYFRRTNNELSEVEHPKLSVLLSSTYDQLLSLIPNAENGLFSRFMFFELTGDDGFSNVFDESKAEYSHHFTSIGEKMQERYTILYQRLEPLRFKLTSAQEAQFVQVFGTLKKEFRDHVSQDLDGVVHRTGLITFRIAMILSVLRLADLTAISQDILCQEVDFVNAMRIMNTLKQHALNVYYRLPTSKRQASNGDQKASKNDKAELIEKAHALRAQGKDYKEIALELCGSEDHKSKVYYWINGRK